MEKNIYFSPTTILVFDNPGGFDHGKTSKNILFVFYIKFCFYSTSARLALLLPISGAEVCSTSKNTFLGGWILYSKLFRRGNSLQNS
jgi:hypothetical protein